MTTTQYGYFLNIRDMENSGDRYRHLILTIRLGRWIDQSKLAGEAARNGQQGMADTYHGKAKNAAALSDSTEIFDCGFRTFSEFSIRWQSSPNLEGWYGGNIEVSNVDLGTDCLTIVSSVMAKIRKAIGACESTDPITMIPAILSAFKALPIRYSGWNHADDGGLREYIHESDPNIAALLDGAYGVEADATAVA